MRNVLVRVFGSDGRPVSGARVVLWIYQFMASGGTDAKYTNADGEVEFSLDVDSGAEISIIVNGDEKTSRGAIRGEYRITL